MKWKGQVKAKTVSDKTICLTDFLATCADIVNEKLPDNAGEDSYSLLPLLTDKLHKFKRKATVLHSVDGYFAIQKGKWKLEMCAGSGGWSAPKPGKEEDGLPLIQLYNLENDIGETKNVQAAYPSVVKELTALLTQYIKNGRSTKGSQQKNDGVFLGKPMAWMKE